jgi:hypothetical protein
VNWWSALWLTTALLLCLPIRALAQQPGIRSYQTEEDLWEALSEGEISYDDFLELLDLSRGISDSLITPNSDWEQLPGADAGYLALPDSSQALASPDSTVDVKPPSRPFSYSLRSGYDADLINAGGGSGYSTVRFSASHVSGLFDVDQDDSRGEQWRRRTLVWESSRAIVQLGTIEPRWGRGLVVGRRSRVITSSGASGTFAQPSRSRFNGLWLNLLPKGVYSAEVVGSDLRSQATKEQFLAVQLLSRRRNWQIGLDVGAGQITNRTSGAYWREGVGGGHIRYQRGPRAFLGEIALTDEGASAKAAELLWPLAHGRLHAVAWSYNLGYTNPWGGGPGGSDTRSVSLPGTNVSFSSRTAGERGLAFTTRLNLAPSIEARWDWMSHAEAPGAPIQHQAVLRIQYSSRRLSVTPFVRARIDEDRTETYSLGTQTDIGPRGRRLNLRYEMGRQNSGADPFVRAGAGLDWRLNGHVRISPAVRWIDPDMHVRSDGYWYLYLTETVTAASGLRLDAVVVWRRYEARSKDDRVELRIRARLR